MLIARTLLAATALALCSSAALAQTQHNVILFVPDGLRAMKVTPETAPAMISSRNIPPLIAITSQSRRL